MFQGASQQSLLDESHHSMVESIVLKVMSEMVASANSSGTNSSGTGDIDDSHRSEGKPITTSVKSNKEKPTKKSKKETKKSKTSKKDKDKKKCDSSAPSSSSKSKKKSDSSAPSSSSKSKKKSRSSKKSDEFVDALGRMFHGLRIPKVIHDDHHRGGYYYDDEAEEIDDLDSAPLPPPQISSGISRSNRTRRRSSDTRSTVSVTSRTSDPPRFRRSSVGPLRPGRHGSSTNSVGSAAFYRDVASKLSAHRNTICIQDEEPRSSNAAGEGGLAEGDFVSSYRPEDMRCLALVSHNEMKSTMREFVLCHKHVLKKFRLTGTATTMKMLRDVFRDDPDTVFGPTCSSGPLGGDAELVALMASGQLGGIFFFQDPMTAHPHQADIDCLNRQAMVHNTVIATTPTTAMTVVQVFEMALREGRAELLPSFFFSLQSPTVLAYKMAQTRSVERLSIETRKQEPAVVALPPANLSSTVTDSVSDDKHHHHPF